MHTKENSFRQWAGLTCLKVSLPSASSDSYTAGMPLEEMIREMGPVMHSALCLNASSSLQPTGFAEVSVAGTQPSLHGNICRS
jgi:hypothetical protein